ncbi:MAG: hypothetical protein LAN62_13095 [Acidobacteriia bacterium]|nr:hypothetical protein [Terriglobia bacterium]
MYIVIEYLTYLTLIGIAAILLFLGSAILLVIREAGKAAITSSQKTATRLSESATKYLTTLSGLLPQRSQQEH